MRFHPQQTRPTPHCALEVQHSRQIPEPWSQHWPVGQCESVVHGQLVVHWEVLGSQHSPARQSAFE